FPSGGHCHLLRRIFIPDDVSLTDRRGRRIIRLCSRAGVKTVLLSMLSLIAGTSVLSQVAVAQEPFVPPPAEVFEETPDDALPAQAELQARIDQLLNRIESLELSESKRLSAEAEKKASASKLPIVNFSQELQLDAYTFNQDA